MNRLHLGINLKTPLHLLSYLAYAEMNHCTENVLFLSNDTLLKFKNYISLLDKYNCKLIVISTELDVKDYISLYITEFNIYLISVNFPKYTYKKIDRKLNLVTINDGLSSYPSFKSMYYNFKRAGRKISLPVLAVKYFGERLLSRLVRYEEFYLYNSKTLDVNNEYLTSIKKILDEIKIIYIANGYIPKFKSKTMIFIGQPLVTLGLVKEQDYIDSIELVERFCLKKGWDFFYKPHPSESHIISMSNEKVIYFDGSIEELFNLECQVVAVSSFYSTSLITLFDFFGANAYRICMPIENLYFSKKQDKLLSKVRVLNDESR